MDIQSSREARTIVRSLVDLGHTWRLKVCCEGVETARRFEFLQSVNCDFAQGYHIGRPMPADKLTELVAGGIPRRCRCPKWRRLRPVKISCEPNSYPILCCGMNRSDSLVRAMSLSANDSHSDADATELKPPILLVEDEPTTRLMTTHQLKKAGYEVDAVANGAEALARLKVRFYPLLITDWEMPEMDGVELCKAVRETDFEGYVYTILLTARDGKASTLRVCARGGRLSHEARRR